MKINTIISLQLTISSRKPAPEFCSKEPQYLFYKPLNIQSSLSDLITFPYYQNYQMSVHTGAQRCTNSPALSFRSVRYRVKSINSKQVLRPETCQPKSLPRPQNSQQSFRPGYMPMDKTPPSTASGTFRVKRSAPNIEMIMQQSVNEWAGLAPLAPLQELKTIDNPTYSETLDKLIMMKQTVRVDREDWRFRNRVSLPLVEDLNPESNYTVLDPIRMQIDFVQTCIDQANKTLIANRAVISETMAELDKIPNFILKNLEQAKNHSKTKLQQFANLMKDESIRHQQNIVRAKDGMVQIRKDLKKFAQEFDQALNRTQNAQQTIFRNVPFELVENVVDIAAEPFDQKLF